MEEIYQDEIFIIYDDGSYRLRRTRQFFPPGRGEAAERVMEIRAQVLREQHVTQRLDQLAEANTQLRQRLSPPPVADTNAAYLPPNCSSTPVPVGEPQTFRLRPVPGGAQYCSFSPLYWILGQSVHITVHANNPPPGDWRVTLFNCTQQFAANGQCNPQVQGIHTFAGPNTTDFVYHHNPFAWVTRKVYFRIRNGSTQPLTNVTLTLRVVNPDPVLQMIHNVLDVAGLLPVIGVVADGANVLIYLGEGDLANAALSAVALAPAFGDSATVVRIESHQVIQAQRREIDILRRQGIERRLQRIRLDAQRSAAAQRRVERPAHPVPEPGSVDHALDPDLGTFEHGAGGLRERGRPRRPRSSALVPSFDDLPLTQAQRAAMMRISGAHFTSLAGFRQVWDEAVTANARAVREVSEITRLFESAGITDVAVIERNREQARRLAREAYNRARTRFWSRVRQRPELRTQLTDAGLQFSGGSGTCPYWEFPDGYREMLTIEHRTRVTDDPRLALSGGNMQFVPFRENTNTLEWIRSLPEFQYSISNAE